MPLFAPPMRAVVARNDGDLWKYIATLGDVHELYALSSDPHETRELSGEPAYAAGLREMRERTAEFLERTGHSAGRVFARSRLRPQPPAPLGVRLTGPVRQCPARPRGRGRRFPPARLSCEPRR